MHDGLNPVQERRGTTIEPILAGIGIDERNAKGSGAGRHYFMNDGVGSTRLLMDANGSVLNRYDYDPYGGTQQTNPLAQNAYQYTGRERDASGLHYYRARYYHSGMARFISEDPLHLAAGDNNLYAYVAGDPISYIDPTGELALPGLLVGLVIGGISGAVGAYVNGGNVWKGALGGAAVGAFVGMTGAYFTGWAAAAGVRFMAGAAGNTVGQLGNSDRPCWKFNWPSLAGSALGGGFSGLISPAAIGTSFSGSLASQFAQRGISGLPGASVSLTGNIVGTQIGKANQSQNCGCL
ncbi:MAG: RHS repeat-associated core domain-containing protein [Pseudoxanthomonas sp.]|nr:RHS repeat-associated core domain-containing protein [Pseudoxanthomonas sp.]